MPKRLPTIKNDFRTVQTIIKEQEFIHGQLVLYERQALRNDGLIDTLHAEVLDSARRFEAPVRIYIRVEPDPPQQLLAKWGIDEQRDVVIYPSVIGLVEHGLAEFAVSDDPTTRPEFFVAIGDRFTWDDQRYEVTEIFREQYWGSTNRPTYLKMTARRWQDSLDDINCGNIGTPGPFAGGQGSALGDG